jgi:hypothetical protein
MTSTSSRPTLTAAPILSVRLCLILSDDMVDFFGLKLISYTREMVERMKLGG